LKNVHFEAVIDALTDALTKVNVNKPDIDFIMARLEITRSDVLAS
jgi:truncated hemoglobin YjbI